MFARLAGVALAIVLAGGGLATAQIEIAAESAPHSPLVATCAVEGTGQITVLWEADPGTLFLELDSGKTIHVWAAPGEHWLRAIAQAVDFENKTARLKQYRAAFTITGTVPDPIVPIDPDDPIPPKPVGKLTAVIIHETEDDIPAVSRMFVSLRSGNNAKWLRDNGHKLIILDDDSTDENGHSLKVVSSLKSLGLQMPALFISDETGRVIKKQTLGKDATGDNVVEYIRRAGG